MRLMMRIPTAAEEALKLPGNPQHQARNPPHLPAMLMEGQAPLAAPQEAIATAQAPQQPSSVVMRPTTVSRARAVRIAASPARQDPKDPQDDPVNSKNPSKFQFSR